MRTMIAVLGLWLVASPVFAQETTDPADSVAQREVRSLGRVNINLAPRAELLRAGLDPAPVDRVLKERARRPIADLTGFSAETRRFLKTEGTSDFRRIRQLPLERLEFAESTSVTTAWR